MMWVLVIPQWCLRGLAVFHDRGTGNTLMVFKGNGCVYFIFKRTVLTLFKFCGIAIDVPGRKMNFRGYKTRHCLFVFMKG